MFLGTRDSLLQYMLVNVVESLLKQTGSGFKIENELNPEDESKSVVLTAVRQSELLVLVTVRSLPSVILDKLFERNLSLVDFQESMRCWDSFPMPMKDE